MKAKEPKVRHTLSYSFTQFEAEQIEQAVKILGRTGWTQFMGERNAKRTLFKWAVIAVARAVVRDEKMPIPLTVDMRFESGEETEQRCGPRVKLPGQAAAKYDSVYLQLPADTAKVLEAWRKKAFKTSRSIDAPAFWILAYAAAHLELLRPAFRKFSDYCEAEGLEQFECLAARSRTQLGIIAADVDDDDDAGEEWKR